MDRKVTAVRECYGTSKAPFGYRLELDGLFLSEPRYFEEKKDFSDKIGKVINVQKTPFYGDLLPLK